MRIIRAIVVALLLASAVGIVSCTDDSPTAPSCSMGPYSWDANVQRCRANNGQFAESGCCGR